MHIGQTLSLYSFDDHEDTGRCFDATVMLIDQHDGVVTLKERGKMPVVQTIQWVAESLAYRRLVEAGHEVAHEEALEKNKEKSARFMARMT